MSRNEHSTGVCAVTGKGHAMTKLIPFGMLRPALAERLLKEHPDLQPDSPISLDAINDARLGYVRDLLTDQMGEITKLDEEVLSSLHKHELLTEHPAAGEPEEKFTFGERVADKIASFGGSWSFILSFMGFLLLWIAVNAWVLTAKPFDPFPFILLNLILSCLAALQAPVIMMSQNRQESRDRTRAENDYKINLKAELEIRHLHEKMDYLLHQQTTRLLEVQQIQVELMRELASRK